MPSAVRRVRVSGALVARVARWQSRAVCLSLSRWRVAVARVARYDNGAPLS